MANGALRLSTLSLHFCVVFEGEPRCSLLHHVPFSHPLTEFANIFVHICRSNTYTNINMHSILALIAILSWVQSLVYSADRWVTTTDHSGSTIYLPDNRKPALYTENFGSCMENPLLTLDNFDASFFRDNMSLTFRFHGATTLDHDDLMSEYLTIYGVANHSS